MNTTIGERYEPYHKIRHAINSVLLEYPYGGNTYYVTLEQSVDPSVYNFVYLNPITRERTVVGKISELPVKTPNAAGHMFAPAGLNPPRGPYSDIKKLIKSHCSRYVIFKCTSTAKMICYAVEPTFSPQFEIFAYKLFEYKSESIVGSTSTKYLFTPSSKFIYCCYHVSNGNTTTTNLVKLDSTTGLVVSKGVIDNGLRSGRYITVVMPVNDNIICTKHINNYNRDTDIENCILVLATEERIIFKLGRVLADQIEWLDCYKVLGDDTWILPATYGQVFSAASADTKGVKMTCLLADNNIYIPYDSRIGWSILCIPIDIGMGKFGGGQVLYSHPITDRDMLCPELAYVRGDKLYGVVAVNENFQLVSISGVSCPVSSHQLELLASGYQFNLPFKEKWDHSKPVKKIDYIDTVVKHSSSSPKSLINKLSSKIYNTIAQVLTPAMTMEDVDDDRSDIWPVVAADDREEHRCDIQSITFTPDLACVCISYKEASSSDANNDMYVYKAKLSYQETDVLINTMDTNFLGLGIELPVEIISDIASTVAVPRAKLDVTDTHRVQGGMAELDNKLLARQVMLLGGDKECIIKKEDTEVVKNMISKRIKLIYDKDPIANIKYSTNPNVRYPSLNREPALTEGLE